MSRPGWRVALLTAVLVLGGLVTACSDDGGDDVDIEADDGRTKVRVDEDSGESRVEIETDEGTYSGGTGTDLPDEFPEDFPVPDDAKVQFSGTQETDEGMTTSVAFLLKGSAEDAFDFYVRELPDAGYEVTQKYSGTAGDGFTGSVAFEGEGATGAVVIGSDGDGKTTASVTITET